MATSDTVVGIVGAVVLTAAMVAVFYYENANVDDRPDGAIGDGGTAYVYEYQRTTKHVVLQEDGAALASGATRSHSFELPPYVWAVNVTLTWSETGDSVPSELPTASGMDRFTLEVFKETGDKMPESPAPGRSGNLQMIHVHPGGSSNTTSRPDAMELTVFADSEAEADRTLANATAGSGKHGVGTWNATVTLNDVGEAATATNTDTGNTYTIRVEIDYWEPVLQRPDAPTTASFMVDWKALRGLFASVF